MKLLGGVAAILVGCRVRGAEQPIDERIDRIDVGLRNA